jgi:hypothetical protein
MASRKGGVNKAHEDLTKPHIDPMAYSHYRLNKPHERGYVWGRV